MHRRKPPDQEITRCSFCSREIDVDSSEAERLWRTGDGISGLVIVCAECSRTTLHTTEVERPGH